MEQNKYDFVIVGGGIAGLYTAYLILQGSRKNKPKVVILEKENNLGGRVYTYNDEHFNVEAGAGRFHSSHCLLFDLIEKLNLQDKIKPIISNPTYIDSSTGNQYPEIISIRLIQKIITESKKVSVNILREQSLISFAKTVLTPKEIKYIEYSFGFSTEFYYMNTYDAVILLTVLMKARPTPRISSFGEDEDESKTDFFETKCRKLTDLTEAQPKTKMILSEQSVDKMIFSGKNINKNKYIYGFYYLSGGLSQIIENLRKKIIVMGGEIQTGVCIENIILPVTKKYPFSTVLKTSSDVFKSSFHESSLTILGKYNEKKFEIVTNNCILALPKQELMKLKNSPKRSVGENHFAVAYEGKMTNLFKEHIFRDIFDKIYCGSLCRIYTKFRDGSWFENLSRFTTQNDLRMVIPMNPKNGTMMISYSDNIYADRWNKLYKTSGMRTMKKRLRELLSECLLFDVPPLGFTRIFYWECGVGYWSIGANSKKISKKMTKPFPNENIFVCGEHYSANHQQWMEGALETSLRVVSQLSL